MYLVAESDEIDNPLHLVSYDFSLNILGKFSSIIGQLHMER
jgi:hypothetical protein